MTNTHSAKFQFVKKELNKSEKKLKKSLGPAWW